MPRNSKFILLQTALALALAIVSFQFVSAREWKSADGKSKVEAEFVALRNGKVVLEKKSGEIVAVPLDRLCAEDIAYVEGRTASANSAPPDAPMKTASPFENTVETKNSSPTSDSTSNPKASATDESEDWRYLRFTRPIKLRGEKPNAPTGIARSFQPSSRGEMLTFSPNGEFLALVNSGHTISIYDVSYSARVSSTDRQVASRNYNSICFTADGQKLLSGTYDGKLVIWKVTQKGTLELETELPLHESKIDCLAVSHDSKLVIVGSNADKKIKICRLEDGSTVLSHELERSVSAVWISPDGTEALAADRESMVRIDVQRQKVSEFSFTENGGFQNVSFSADGKLMAASSFRTYDIFDTTNGENVFRADRTGSALGGSMLIDSENRRVLIDKYGYVEVWDIETEEKIESIEMSQQLSAADIVFSPDNKHFAVSLSSGPLYIIRIGPKEISTKPSSDQ